MSKVIEETWVLEEHGNMIMTPYASGGMYPIGSFPTSQSRSDLRLLERSRAALASAAPEMARLLLAAEWSGTRGWGPPCCPWCEGFAPDEQGEYGKYTKVANNTGHRSDCELLAVLRKAGLR